MIVLYALYVYDCYSWLFYESILTLFKEWRTLPVLIIEIAKLKAQSN